MAKTDHVFEDAGGILVPVGSTAGQVLAAIHGVGAIDVPAPLSAPILLLEHARVAGTAHARDIAAIVEELAPGDRLRFTREPSNLHDRWAIQVSDAHGRKMGYVPADCNQMLARLMDGGKQLYGVFTEAALKGEWHRVTMEVYLDD